MEGGAAITLVSTKLTAPRPPAQLVDRGRLDEMLDMAVASATTKVVLVSAPAGSGKSTLVAAWSDRSIETVAWLQADAADSDPGRFWTYLVAALSTVMPDLQTTVAPAIPGAASNPRPLVEKLANELDSFPTTVALVIDDYHLVSHPAIDEGLEQLVELAPNTFTLVLCSRMDPSLRLSRLRVRGQLAEVRADDLRFAHNEAADLLQQRGPAPAPHEVEALCERTEGWAAGLVLAGMSLATSTDRDAFVADFHGDDRLVVDYLTDEFLSGVSSEDRRRLLQTSILDRLSGALIDALCGSTDGTVWLRDAAAANQLLIGLDRTGTWYRYHHLLGDLLRLEAETSIGGELAQLHEQAGRWHQTHGSSHDAVEHYLRGGHLQVAADLIYDEATELMNGGQLRTVRTQIDRLGPVADKHAGATVVRGWISLLTGKFADAQLCVSQARTLDPNDDEAGLIVALAIMTHIASGNVASALDEVGSASDPFESTQAMAFGSALVWGGDHNGARPFLDRAEALAPGEKNAFVETVTPIYLAISAIESSDNDTARRDALRAINKAERNGFEDLAQVALAHSILARTSDNRDDAIAAAKRGVELAKKSPERIMLAYALASGGDVLCDLDHSDGEVMLHGAREIIDRCPDPGIAGRYLAKTEARHHLSEPAPSVPELIDDLTDRELAVLRYLPSQLSQRDIASELYVSLNTVKTHCKAIYRKLAVNDRKAAVQAARDIDLL